MCRCNSSRATFLFREDIASIVLKISVSIFGLIKFSTSFVSTGPLFLKLTNFFISFSIRQRSFPTNSISLSSESLSVLAPYLLNSFFTQFFNWAPSKILNSWALAFLFKKLKNLLFPEISSSMKTKISSEFV